MGKPYYQADNESNPVEPKQVDAKGEKLLKDPGKSDRKHDNEGHDSGCEDGISPKLKESGKME